jgi:hypothetical protein
MWVREVETGPPWRDIVDDRDGVVDAQAMSFGIEDPDVEALIGSVGRDISHAEHGQSEVVDSGSLTVVAKRGIDEQRI